MVKGRRQTAASRAIPVSTVETGLCCDYPMRMKLDEIRQVILGQRSALAKEGVRHLSLFGSRVRGEARADSDLDVLLEVDPEAKFSILDLVGVEQMISESTGVNANAFMRRSLDPEFRKSIGDEVLDVF